MVRYYEFCRLNEGRRPLAFDSNKINDILNRARSGESFRTIAKDFNCGHGVIIRIIQKNTTLEEYEEIVNINKIQKIDFTADQIKDIIKRLRNDESLNDIGKDLGCSRMTIRNVIQANTTPEKYAEIVKWIAQPLNFTDDQRTDIVSRAIAGETFVSLSKDFHCSNNTIRTIVRKNTSPAEYAEILYKQTGKTAENMVKKGVTLELAKKWGEAYAAGHSMEQVAKMFDLKVSYGAVAFWLPKLDNFAEIKRLHNEKVEHKQAMTTKTPKPGTIDNERSKGPGSRHTQGVDWPNYNKGGE